ncbi:MAG: biotin carboxylase N-terminal domain-containing protein [Syntrophales bacterium]
MFKGKIKKVLIADRGEIALHIIRTVKELGLSAVAIYEKPDSEAYLLRSADDAIMIGNGPRKDYADIDKIIWAAQKSNADAIHPGSGFSSENHNLSRACEEAGIIFIGPTSNTMQNLRNKVTARKIMEKANIPLIPGTGNLNHGEAEIEEAVAFGRKHGYPLMLKSSAGSSGKGIKKVLDEKELLSQLPVARSEAISLFNDDNIYLEKYLEAPRHVEIQILADHHGNIIHLGSRDCSFQWKYQKLLEIAPAELPPDVMKLMYENAIKVAREINYVSAGTVQFLVDPRTNEFLFMDVKTTLQSEHAITEALTLINIVREQIRIAEGHTLEIPQERINMIGKAIQVRINAEDPQNNFMPEGGKIVEVYQPSGGLGIRLDGDVYQGYRIPKEYDSLMVKLTVRGYNWEQTIQRLKRALKGFLIAGPKTTIPLYLAVCDEQDFKAEKFDTSYVETHPEIFNYPEMEREIAKLARLIAEIHVKKINPYAY